jgi:hypothetical protein
MGAVTVLMERINVAITQCQELKAALSRRAVP